MKKLCTVEVNGVRCERPHRAKGRCTLHYNRLLAGIPDAQRIKARPQRGIVLSECCRLPGCGRRARSFGLCQQHRAKQLANPGNWSGPLLPHPAALPVQQMGDMAVPLEHFRVLEEEALRRGVKRAHVVREAVAAWVERVQEARRQEALEAKLYGKWRRGA